MKVFPNHQISKSSSEKKKFFNKCSIINHLLFYYSFNHFLYYILYILYILYIPFFFLVTENNKTSRTVQCMIIKKKGEMDEHEVIDKNSHKTLLFIFHVACIYSRYKSMNFPGKVFRQNLMIC